MNTIAAAKWHVLELAEAIPVSADDLGKGSSHRCTEKACVFPAQVGSGGMCLYHEREQREPACFHSQQPSQLLLESAKFGVTDPECVSTRVRDRQKLISSRESFLESA